ncbi:hypothetical protein Tco_0813286 [Tanacetum coccineum]
MHQDYLVWWPRDSMVTNRKLGLQGGDESACKFWSRCDCGGEVMVMKVVMDIYIDELRVVITYKADDHEKEKEEEKANDDNEVSSDQMVLTPPDYEILDEEENREDDDNVMGGEQEDEELYGELNLNLDRRDAEITDAQTN